MYRNSFYYITMTLLFLYPPLIHTRLPTTDKEAYHFCTHNSDAFIAIVWPLAQGKDAEIIDLFEQYGSVIYKKEQRITPALARYLFPRIHQNLHLTTAAMVHHITLYFPPQAYTQPARIFVITCRSARKVLKCKYAIRDLFNLGYTSIHINDTHPETIELAHLFFTHHPLYNSGYHNR